MPLMIERAVPYIARAKRLSSSGVTMICFLSLTESLTTPAKVWWTRPFGPST